jgi:hypothetical protein
VGLWVALGAMDGYHGDAGAPWRWMGMLFSVYHGCALHAPDCQYWYTRCDVNQGALPRVGWAAAQLGLEHVMMGGAHTI